MASLTDMLNLSSEVPLGLLILGCLLVLAMLAKMGLERTGLPVLLGYLALGFLLRATDSAAGILDPFLTELLHFLGGLGVVALLFRVGLESDLEKLLAKLREASAIAASGVVLCLAGGFAVCRWLLGLELAPSLVVGTALVATSVGIPAAIWRENEAIESDDGQLFLDLAELDDLIGVTVMAVLLSLLPLLAGHGQSNGLGGAITGKVGIFAVKFLLLGALCFVFSRYLEKPITHFFCRAESQPDPMIFVAALGTIIAAMAGLLGFSVAIGAFFAGIVFSRDPEAVRATGSFDTIYDLLVPFFFISIGARMQLSGLGGALGWAVLLFTVAALTKLLGHGLPAWGLEGRQVGLLIGVSMIPRAEITMIVMEHGRTAGAVSGRLYSAMILVAAATCVVGPLLLKPLIRRRQRE